MPTTAQRIKTYLDNHEYEWVGVMEVSRALDINPSTVRRVVRNLLATNHAEKRYAGRIEFRAIHDYTRDHRPCGVGWPGEEMR